MAAKRDNTTSRWTVVIASGVAAAAFWLGIVYGPQPANANPPQTAAVQTTAAPRQFQGRTGSGFASPSQSQPQARAITPRLRTRGS